MQIARTMFVGIGVYMSSVLDLARSLLGSWHFLQPWATAALTFEAAAMSDIGTDNEATDADVDAIFEASWLAAEDHEVVFGYHDCLDVDPEFSEVGRIGGPGTSVDDDPSFAVDVADALQVDVSLAAGSSPSSPAIASTT